MKLRIPRRMSTGRGQPPLLTPPPALERPPGAAELLFATWAGRVFLASATLKLLISILRRFITPPSIIELVSVIASLGLAFATIYVVARLFILAKRRLLWRVRRKLILSYIFIGVVPALLIVGFFLLSANVAAMNVSAYLFKDGYDDIVSDVKLVAQAAAGEIGRQPGAASETLRRSQSAVGQRYPTFAMAFLPTNPRAGGLIQAGEWEHQPAPTSIPPWAASAGFDGTTFIAGDEPGEVQLVIRSVVPARGPAGDAGFVVADVPVDDHLLDRLRETTGVKARTPRFTAPADGKAVQSDDKTAQQLLVPLGTEIGTFAPFKNSVTFLDTVNWENGRASGATVSMVFDVGE